MNQATAVLEIEQNCDMLILKPEMDLQDLDELEIEEAANELSERMDHSGLMDVFLDIQGIDVFHSQVPLSSRIVETGTESRR